MSGNLVIGLTGGSGSGKTTAAALLRDLGADLIDCDAVYHELLRTDRSLLRAIDDAFPGTVADGALDRKRLGGIVFRDPRALQRLSALTEPFVYARVQALLQAQRGVVLLEAIRLFEAGLDRLCDACVAVCAPRPLRIERLVRREGVSAGYAALRIDAQCPEEVYRARCRYILDNDCDRNEFARRCACLYREITGDLRSDPTTPIGPFPEQEECYRE